MYLNNRVSALTQMLCTPQTRAAIGAADLAGRAAALAALLRRRAARGGLSPEPEARAELSRQAPPQGGAALTAGD